MLGEVSDARQTMISDGSDGPCLLAPVLDDRTRRRAAAVAHAIASDRDAELLIGGTDDGTASTAADAPAFELPESHRDGYCAPAQRIDLRDGLRPTIAARDASILVLERARDPGLLSDLRTDTAERLADATDVVTVDGRGEIDTIASILVPVAGGPHSHLAVETARAIAEANDAAIDLFHVTDGRERAVAEGRATLDRAAAALGDVDDADTWLYEADDVATAIVEQSSYYDLTVMGAPTTGPLKRFVFGSTTKDVQRAADSPVVVAHSRAP